MIPGTFRPLRRGLHCTRKNRPIFLPINWKQRLLEDFGSLRGIRQAAPDALVAVVNQATADKIRKHFADETANPSETLPVLQ